MSLSSFFSILQTLVILAIVILLANLSLKYVSKYMSKNNNMIKIVERVAVTNNSSLSVVEICGTYYLMSTGNENKILKELDIKDVEPILKEIEKKQKLAMDNHIFSRIDYHGIKKKVKNYYEMRKKIE